MFDLASFLGRREDGSGKGPLCQGRDVPGARDRSVNDKMPQNKLELGM